MNAMDVQVHAGWQEARRVLAVRLDNLGDVLVTTPAIHAIRESLPEASITLLASEIGAQAGRLNPDIDEVIVHSAPWMDPWSRLPLDPARESQSDSPAQRGELRRGGDFHLVSAEPVARGLHVLPRGYSAALGGLDRWTQARCSRHGTATRSG